MPKVTREKVSGGSTGPATRVQARLSDFSFKPYLKGTRPELSSPSAPSPAVEGAAIQLPGLGKAVPSVKSSSGASEKSEAKEVMRRRMMANPSLAQRCLKQYLGVKSGWCDLVSVRSNKEGDNGYIQVSYGGVNKFAVLHEVVLWAQGETCAADMQASHLCNRKKCKKLGHVYPESATENNSRKNCPCWIDCPLHTGKKILLCTHRPHCEALCIGDYEGMAGALAGGAFCSCGPVGGSKALRVREEALYAARHAVPQDPFAIKS